MGTRIGTKPLISSAALFRLRKTELALVKHRSEAQKGAYDSGNADIQIHTMSKTKALTIGTESVIVCPMANIIV